MNAQSRGGTAAVPQQREPLYHGSSRRPSRKSTTQQIDPDSFNRWISDVNERRAGDDAVRDYDWKTIDKALQTPDAATRAKMLDTLLSEIQSFSILSYTLDRISEDSTGKLWKSLLKIVHQGEYPVLRTAAANALYCTEIRNQEISDAMTEILQRKLSSPSIQDVAFRILLSDSESEHKKFDSVSICIQNPEWLSDETRMLIYKKFLSQKSRSLKKIAIQTGVQKVKSEFGEKQLKTRTGFLDALKESGDLYAVSYFLRAIKSKGKWGRLKIFLDTIKAGTFPWLTEGSKIAYLKGRKEHTKLPEPVIALIEVTLEGVLKKVNAT